MSWQALEVFSFYCTNQLVVKELQLYFDFENLLIFFFSFTKLFTRIQSYLQRNVHNILVLSNWSEYQKDFQYYKNYSHINMSLTREDWKGSRMSFLDIDIIRGPGKLPTSVCQCFKICQTFIHFHLKFFKLISIFKKKGYSENFLNNCFKRFPDNTEKVNEKIGNVLKKPIFSVLLYLAPASL